MCMFGCCGSQIQPLGWGCGLKGAYVQIPATGYNKDPGAATGQTECLRSDTRGVHMYLHVYKCVCMNTRIFIYFFQNLAFSLISQKWEKG